MTAKRRAAELFDACRAGRSLEYVEKLVAVQDVESWPFTREDVDRLRKSEANCREEARRQMDMMRAPLSLRARADADFYASLAERIEARFYPPEASEADVTIRLLRAFVSAAKSDASVRLSPNEVRALLARLDVTEDTP